MASPPASRLLHHECIAGMRPSVARLAGRWPPCGTSALQLHAYLRATRARCFRRAAGVPRRLGLLRAAQCTPPFTRIRPAGGVLRPARPIGRHCRPALLIHHLCTHLQQHSSPAGRMSATGAAVETAVLRSGREKCWQVGQWTRVRWVDAWPAMAVGAVRALSNPPLRASPPRPTGP